MELFVFTRSSPDYAYDVQLNSTGLDYADQRFYASSYGRFNTADPYAGSAGSSDPGSWNRYSYTRGDPVNRIDPGGTCDISISGWGFNDGWFPYTSCDASLGPDFNPAAYAECLAVYACARKLPGGGGPSVQGGGANFTVANFTTTGVQAQTVQNSLRWIEAQIASFPTCDNWLGGNDNVTNTINTLLGQTNAVTTDSVGVGNFSNPAVNAVFGTAGTNLPTDGSALLTVNLNGAYFNSQAGVGWGVTGINAGSSQAQLFILLHELAHGTNAAGFQSNDSGQAIQTQNNQLLMRNCAGFIKSVSN